MGASPGIGMRFTNLSLLRHFFTTTIFLPQRNLQRTKFAGCCRGGSGQPQGCKSRLQNTWKKERMKKNHPCNIAQTQGFTNKNLLILDLLTRDLLIHYLLTQNLPKYLNT
jgi:hypothetical protein